MAKITNTLAFRVSPFFRDLTDALAFSGIPRRQIYEDMMYIVFEAMRRHPDGTPTKERYEKSIQQLKKTIGL